MVPTYRVIALRMGTLTVDKSSLTLGVDFGREIEIPIWAAAIEGDGHRVLVDTGIADRQWVEENVAPCRQTEKEHIDSAMKTLDWEPQSIEAVINTHLHYDHCGGNALFPNTRFYVSPIEWDYAENPVTTQQVFYDGAWKRNNIGYFSYYFSGDHFEVLPGIRILKTPGHTPGHQSVIVNTNEGVVAITGDAMNVPENFNESSPPGILHDTTAALNSIRRIRVYADRIITGHDPGVEAFQDQSFPKTK